jgi:hypothetical protein
LSNDELQALSNAIRQANPGAWNLGKLNVAAPDAIKYELELKWNDGSGDRTNNVVWYDNTREQLPDDLSKLYEMVSQLRQAVAKKCGV